MAESRLKGNLRDHYLRLVVLTSVMYWVSVRLQDSQFGIGPARPTNGVVPALLFGVVVSALLVSLYVAIRVLVGSVR